MESFVIIADILEKVVLVSLAGLSVWSVQVMIEQSRRQKNENWLSLEHVKSLLEANNLAGVRHACDGQKGMLAGALLAAVDAATSSKSMTPNSVDRAVASFVKEKKVDHEKGLVVLATLGANAPFIGLFGTVLGIIRSFAYLGMQSGSSAVMSGISQALVATAIGLFVAIPAVVAFNYYSKKNRDLLSKIESLRDFLVARIG